MITMNQLRVLPLLLSVGLSACAANTETPAQQAPLPAVEESKSLLARSTTPAITAPEYGTFAKDRNTVAIALYKQIASTYSGNLVYSPQSVSTALGMAYAGAAGSTKSEMARALGFSQPDALVHAGFNMLDADLAGRGTAGGKGADGGAFRFNVANGVFADKTLAAKATFLDTLALNYGAGVKRLDYAGAPDVARAQINAWVAQKTEDQIKNLLPQGSISTDTRMTLVNAVYMNAAWETPFDDKLSSDGSFVAASGSVTVPFMKRSGKIRFAKVAGATIVELPYDKSGLSMVLVLPPEGGLSTLESVMTEATLAAMISAVAPDDAELVLPRFKIAGASVSLKQTLGALGMNQAFSAEADFSAISGEKLHIGDVIHKAMIDVGEKGTVAAAATAVTFDRTSAVRNYINFNRAFLFAVRDQKSGAFLFMGRLVDPSKN